MQDSFKGAIRQRSRKAHEGQAARATAVRLGYRTGGASFADKAARANESGVEDEPDEQADDRDFWRGDTGCVASRL
jgi:hypothetical protein